MVRCFKMNFYSSLALLTLFSVFFLSKGLFPERSASQSQGLFHKEKNQMKFFLPISITELEPASLMIRDGYLLI